MGEECVATRGESSRYRRKETTQRENARTFRAQGNAVCSTGSSWCFGRQKVEEWGKVKRDIVQTTRMKKTIADACIHWFTGSCKLWWRNIRQTHTSATAHTFPPQSHALVSAGCSWCCGRPKWRVETSETRHRSNDENEENHRRCMDPLVHWKPSQI